MLSRRMLNLKPSAVMELSRRAKELQTVGEDVISLSIGEPTWETFEPMREAAIQAIQEGYTKYTESGGSQRAKDTIITYTEKTIGLKIKPSQVFVTVGSKYALFTAIQALCEPEDEVLIPTPYWVSYPAMVDLSGATLRPIPTKLEDEFILTRDQLEKHINKRTKLLLLNSPNNPSGAVFSSSALEAIAKVLLKHPKIFILTDDIYNHLYFSKPMAPHLLQICPELKDRVVAVNAVSKNYSMPGWRLGWAIGHEKIISAMARYQSQTLSCANSIAQETVARGLLKCDKEIEQTRQNLIQLKKLSLECFNDVKGFEVFPPKGAFYIWIKVSNLFNSSYKNQPIRSAESFTEALFKDQRVLLAPGEAFAYPGYVRVHFAVEEEQIKSATERIKKFVSTLS